MATTSTITRNCDRPIDEGRRPREEETHHEAGEKSTTEATRRDREPKITEAKQRDRSGEVAAHEECERVQLTKSARRESDDKKPWC